jgi:hypothetical protein
MKAPFIKVGMISPSLSTRIMPPRRPCAARSWLSLDAGLCIDRLSVVATFVVK